jgi:pyochelin biosynthetic protein PchC
MGPWLRRHAPDGVTDRRLVCFPHAGGTARVFANWPGRLPVGVELIAVQYPGRQDRIREPCVEDMNEMADQLAVELAPFCDLPLRMFGHSMGSAVAYEVALRLERNPDSTIDRIFVSARMAPHRRHGEPNHRLGDEDLVAEIRRLGGPDREVYDFPKLWPIILPPLRADLRLLDRHRPASLANLRSPITALGGDHDHTCAVDDLKSWHDATEGGCEILTFAGGHHFLADNESEIIATLCRGFLAESMKRE